jgi:drug/metabolite transporter (DMT)-like permease
MNQSTPQTADAKSWGMLLLLSLVWGGSFLFIAIAVKELAALEIVLARVGLAAGFIVPVHLLWLGKLPFDRRVWIAAGGMSVMNNVIPFTLITWGQHFITGGLASVVNATTPMFAAIFMAIAGYEAFTGRKAIALVIGLIGVVVLKGVGFEGLSAQSLGILAVALASASYGLSATWSKKMLVGIPPLTTATCQLLISAVLMTVIVVLFGDVTQYASVSTSTWIALVGLAVVSTSFAYLLFFRIIERAGPSFVSLVTMIIPVSAILLGYFVIGEKLTVQDLIGTAIIGIALIVIDGRLLKRFGLIKA